MEPFLQQLISLAQTDPTRTKWVVAPSLAVGNNIAERLISEGIVLGNFRFTNTLDLAARIAGPALARKKTALMDPAVGPAPALELLLDLPSTSSSYFREIAEQPGVAEALWSTIRELRLAGIGALALKDQHFVSPAKAKELRTLMQTYEHYLDEHRLADAAASLKTATTAANKFPITADSLLLEMAGSCGSSLEREFLDSLPARHIPAQTTAVPGLQLPASLSRLNTQIQLVEPSDETSDASRLTWLARPAEAPPPVHDGSLTLFGAAGREAEVEEVIRRIQAASLPLGSVEVVCAQPAEYAPLFWEKAARHNLAVTIDRGIPGTLTRPVRAALGLCDWIENNFPAVRLARMLEAGILDPGSDKGLSWGAAARILRRCGATLGRKSYGAALAAYAASCEERAGDIDVDEHMRATHEQRASRARQLAVWVASLLKVVPEPSNGLVELGSLLDALACTLDDSVSVGGPHDAEAKAAVESALQSLAPVRGLRRSMSFHLALIRTQLESVVVAAARPSPEAFHVSSLGSPSFAGRSATFVVGLAEGAVFPAGLEDPVLLDDERRAIASERLVSSQDRTNEAVYRAIVHLTCLRGWVTFSYSCRDLRQGREAYPSWLLFQAQQLLKPGSALKYKDFMEWLGDPVTIVAPVQSDTTSDVGWWLSGLRGIGSAAMPLVSAAFPGIAFGILADDKRQSEEFTEYDGLVTAAGADLDPRGADQVFSASRFENYATCPFRFFLNRGLGLDPVDDEEPDPDVWLDPMVRGDVLHGIYAEFLRRLRAEKRRPIVGDWKTLWQIAQEKLDRQKEAIPPRSEAIYAAEKQQLERDLRLFFQLEMARADVLPVGFEVPFGMGEAHGEEPLSQPEALRIKIGSGEIRLRGRIDRIDRLADGSFEVIDYKTGVRGGHFDGIFSGGRLLQHALYASAARQLLRPEQKDPQVAFSSYYFCTERGWGELVRKPGNLDVRPVLNDIADAIAAGVFVRGGEGGDCTRCDYKRACPEFEMQLAAAKREALIPIERLASHE